MKDKNKELKEFIDNQIKLLNQTIDREEIKKRLNGFDVDPDENRAFEYGIMVGLEYVLKFIK